MVFRKVLKCCLSVNCLVVLCKQVKTDLHIIAHYTHKKYRCRINGPLAAFVSYIAEFHSSKHRTRIIIVRGMIVHSAKFLLPLLAWSVFPLDLHYSFFKGYIGTANKQISIKNQTIYQYILLWLLF